jgi:hypothetical protein
MDMNPMRDRLRRNQRTAKPMSTTRLISIDTSTTNLAKVGGVVHIMPRNKLKGDH